MSQTQRVSGRSTSVVRRDGQLRVTYHQTDVVTVDVDGTITLRSGGWQSHTTKTRMNQASNQYGLGYQVYQKDHIWFVDYKGRTLRFFDGMVL